MPEPGGFADHIDDLLDRVGEPFSRGASIRRMLGGQGIFCDGVMFALIADDIFYLKVDDTMRAAFAAAGSEPFVYTRAGKQVALSYFTLPESASEDVDELRDWAHMALGAAERAQAGKPKRKSR
jgi:DNA transformation protein